MIKNYIKYLKYLLRGNWEEVIDFTKIKKDGVDIDEILSRL
jgi:hypothetical protein